MTRTGRSQGNFAVLHNAATLRLSERERAALVAPTMWNSSSSRNGTLWNVQFLKLSLHLDPSRLDHLGPFFGIRGDERAEVGG